MSISAKLLEDELNEFCGSDSLSEDGLREIIEKHECAPKNNDQNINNYEFFHSACRNEQITKGILRYLLEYFPNAVRAIGDGGRLPLHIICCFNKNVTLGMVQQLIDAFPDSVRHETNKGSLPLHGLCNNENLDEEGGLEILMLFLERCPEAIRHANRDGILPLHLAAREQSPEFCRILIEAYPGSERITDAVDGILPFHAACALNTIATVKNLYKLYPESINVADNYGRYPIHLAAAGLKFRDNSPETAIEITQFLLDCDPSVALHQYRGKLPLHWGCNCNWATNDNTQQRLDACLKVLQILYDAHPEAIEDNAVTDDVDEFCAEVQTFINTQITYARQARDHHLMITPDSNGQLPLHRALRDNVTLGSIKLLVKGNPSAISCADGTDMIPLHVACQHHKSANVIDYLVGLDSDTLTIVDREGNTALHHACRGANHAMIALLTDKYGAVSVSKRNAHGQLPIDVLFASREVSDREGIEYTESIFRLLRAYPATLMNCIPNTTRTSHPGSKMSGKKRKIDNIQEEEEGYYSYLSSVRTKLIQTFWGR